MTVSYKFLKYFFGIMILLIFQCSMTYGQNNATIKGVVKDATTGDLLPGANIVIVGTNLGAASDIYGKYYLGHVPVGNVKIKISYVGYQTLETVIKTDEKTTSEINFDLKSETIYGKEIVVTGQAKGQTEAINQQLTSKNIVDVVSSARIQELPDQNAAESVGHLPGASVLRTGGEGDKVVIRGMAPKFNNIEVAGVKMTSTDPNDRSVDLSMISPHMLEGIEVTKAITPDMDANAIGGTVKFKLKEAPDGLKYDLLTQGGYSDLKQNYNNYKIVGSGSNRYFNNDFGAFAQVDIEGKNNSSNNEGASYELVSPKLGQANTMNISSLNLNDYTRYLHRYGGTVVLDYRIPDGSIILNNFYSASNKKVWTRGQSFDLDAVYHYYTAGYSEVNTNVLTNSLQYTQNLPIFNVDALITHSYTTQTTPKDFSYDFQENNALKKLNRNIAPNEVPKYAIDSLQNTTLQDVNQYDWNLKDRELTAQLNLSREFNLFDLISATIKTGGKYGYKDRSYDYTAYTGVLNAGSGQTARSAILDAYPWMQSMVSKGALYLPYPLFIDHNYNMHKFINGEYNSWPVADIGLMQSILDVLKNFSGTEAYHRNAFSSAYDSYSGNEYASAGYAMADLEYGDLLSVITGIRYEQLEREYTAPHGNSTIGIASYKYVYTDTTTTVTDRNWLPMISLKFKPLDWFDIRFAYTTTLSRPDFTAITPLMNIGTASVTMNNYQLKPARSQNFDLYLSFHENTLGLFTIGGFKKKIHDMIFATNNKVILDPAALGLPKEEKGLYLYTDLNDPNPVNLYGVEVSWQTNFWYLPGFLKGFVLNVNYTNTHSDAKYPMSILYTKILKKAPWVEQTQVDTFYTARMIDQPNNIANVSLGYDYEGFSARISFVYQSNIFIAANFWSELRENTADYRRWDFSVKQKLPWYGLEVYADVLNIGNSENKNIYTSTQFPTSEQYYGMSMDLGVRWRVE